MCFSDTKVISKFEPVTKMKKIGPRMGARIPGGPLDLPTLHMLCTDSDNKKDVFFDWIYDAFKIFSLLQVIP